MAEHLADRKTARMLGHNLYQGRSCPKGHSGARYVNNKACVECERDRWSGSKRSGELVQIVDNVRYRAQHIDLLARPDVAANQAEAIRTGKLYYLGRRCKNGHAGVRYASCRTCTECVIDQTASVRRLDPERNRKITSEWAKANPERRYAVIKRWRKRNPEKFRELARAGFHSRRAKLKSVPGKHTAQEAMQIREAQGGACAYCGTTASLSLDHKVPISRGGTNYAFNLQWLCTSHNSKKRNRTDEEYRTMNGIPLHTPWDASIFTCESVALVTEISNVA